MAVGYLIPGYGVIRAPGGGVMIPGVGIMVEPNVGGGAGTLNPLSGLASSTSSIMPVNRLIIGAPR